MNKLLILTLIFLFIGCSQEKPKTYAKLSISSKSFTAEENERVILYAINKDKNEQRALILDQNSVGLDLEFGNWQFVTLAWEEDEFSQSVLKCGKASKNFNQVEDSLSIYMSSESCDDDLFAGEDFRSNGNIKELSLINCQDVTGIQAGQNCDYSDRGFAGSYRISVLGHSLVSRNSLFTISAASADKITSQCISSEAYPTSATPTGIRVPVGSSDFKAPFLIEVFEEDGCDGAKKEYFFPNGPSMPLAGTRSTLLSSENTVDLHLEFGKIYLEGPVSFGQGLINQTSNMTVVFKNSSSVPLSELSASIGAPFSILSNSCGSSVPKKGNCSIVLNFTPSDVSSYSQNLVINYKKENVSQTLSQSISGTGVTNMAPVTSPIQLGTVAEDSVIDVSLQFTDYENDFPTSCGINSKYNLTISQPCYCNAAGCFVSLKGDQDYYGPAEFTYSVVTNGATSNISTVSVIFAAQDDAPVANVFSPSEAYEDVEKMIVLDYFDADYDEATSCTIESTTNVSVTQACSCASGVCTVGLTSSPEFSGIASFTYSVTANASESNLQMISYSVMAVDDAPVAPAVTTINGNEDASITVQLPFWDAEADAPSACNVTNLSNVSVVTACFCQGNYCSVGVIGNSNYNGQASFNYTVSANGKTSNNGEVNLAIAPIDDAPVINAVGPANFNEDATTTLNISYSDPENNLASTCHIQSVTSLSIVQSCTCSNGQCSMQVTGSPANFNGYAYMSVILLANNLSSQSFNAPFLINSVDDAPVASNINASSLNEDTSTIINLSYNDVESHQAAICTVTSTNNVFITQPCSCLNGACTVGVQGNMNYNGSAGFNYTVMANGLVSAPASVGLTILPVNDIPRAENVSDKFLSNTEMMVHLRYFDPDQELATSCSVLNQDHVYISTSCGCTNGECSVGVTGDYNYLGLAGFTYTISVGNDTSTASAILNPNYPNNFITIPQNMPGYNQLASNNVFDIHVMNNGKIFALTDGGLSISTNSGYTFKNVTTAQGLGMNYINNIFIDGNNTIYVATPGGLSISNNGGESFVNKVIDNSPVRSVAVDGNGKIYAGLTGGLKVSTNGGTSFSMGMTGTPSIDDIFISSNGNIYLSTTTGLYISTDSGATYSNKSTTNGLGSSNINSAFVDSNGTLYVGTAGGLSISTDGGSTFSNKTTSNGLGNNNVKEVYVASSGTIYAATLNGLSISTDGGATFTNNTTAQGLASTIINGLFVNSYGHIYASTNLGYSYSTNGGTSFSTISNSSGFSYSNITNVFVDNFGKIYASTSNSGFGISYNQGASFIKKTTSDGLGSNNISSLIATPSGKIFVATDNGLSISLDGGNSFSNKTTSNGLPTNVINSVAVKPNGTIYVAHNSGLSLSFNNGTSFVNKTTANGLGANLAKKVFVALNGNIYVATTGLSISTDGGESFVTKTTAHGLIDNVVNDVFVTSGGIIYVVSNNGLSISYDGGNSFYGQNIGSLKSIFVDNNGVIYAVSSAGLYVSLNNGISFTSRNLGISSVFANSVFVDMKGQIYVATMAGLSVSIANTILAWTTINDLLASSHNFGTPAMDTQAYLNVKNLGNIPTGNLAGTVSGALNFTYYPSLFDCTTLDPGETCPVTLNWSNLGTSGVKNGTATISDGSISAVLNLSGTK